MKTRFYYTINEIFNTDGRTINYGSEKLGVYAFVSYLLQYDTPIATDNDISKELMKHIWLNIAEKNVIAIDRIHPVWVKVERPTVDEFTEQDVDVVLDFAQSFLSLYEDTKQYYETLIGLYTTELSKLMDDIASESQTRFNDTPQNVQSGSAYTADNYSTNVTTTKQQTNLTSKMNRLNEVQNMLRNLYGDWAFEFNKFIFDEVEMY